MKSRIKTKPLPVPQLSSRNDMESAVAEVTAMKLRETELTAAMDKEITAIRSQYEDRMAEIRARLDTHVSALMAWAENNRSEFGKTKSLDAVHGTIGWRTGTPSLKTLSGWTWDRVLEKLELLGLADYVRIKREVDKQKIIADRELFADGAGLKEIGVRCQQDDFFFVDPKIQHVDRRETSEFAS